MYKIPEVTYHITLRPLWNVWYISRSISHVHVIKPIWMPDFSCAISGSSQSHHCHRCVAVFRIPAHEHKEKLLVRRVEQGGGESRDGAVLLTLTSHPFADSPSYGSWVCCWFSFFQQEVFLQILCFSPFLKNQHFQIPVQCGECPQIVRCAKYINTDLVS